jgi:hypothetical protein
MYTIHEVKIQQLLFSDFKYIAYIAYLLDFYNIENDDFHLQILFSVIKSDFLIIIYLTGV